MAPRSSVSQLPEDVRDDLNRRLVASNFSGYEGMAKWLHEQGFEISKSALHRHGSALEADFEEAMADVRRTRALARAVKTEGDEGEVLAATSGILQEQLLRISIALRTADSDPAEAAKSISMVARAHSDVGRLQVALSKWQEELKAKCQAAAEQVRGIGERAQLSPEVLAEITERIYGLTA